MPANCNPATYHGLHEWHKYLFEKLGWMMLTKAKRNLNPAKIAGYVKSIELLECSLKDKINKVKEDDRKTDLNILLENVLILRNIANLHLGSEKVPAPQKPNMVQLREDLTGESQAGGAKKTKKPSRKGSRKVAKKNSKKY